MGVVSHCLVYMRRAECMAIGGSLHGCCPGLRGLNLLLEVGSDRSGVKLFAAFPKNRGQSQVRKGGWLFVGRTQVGWCVKGHFIWYSEAPGSVGEKRIAWPHAARAQPPTSVFGFLMTQYHSVAGPIFWPDLREVRGHLTSGSRPSGAFILSSVTARLFGLFRPSPINSERAFFLIFLTETCQQKIHLHPKHNFLTPSAVLRTDTAML